MSFLDENDDSENGNEENGDDESGDPNITSISTASSAIANLTYHHDTSELFMTFTDGRNYVIEDFPEIEFERWIAADSIGGYFNAFVRGNY